MGKVILGVTISLDGFAEDNNGSVGALYPDLDTLRNTEVLRESIHTTGSVVMAWKEFAMAEDPDWFAGNYEYQVPIFVFTDKAPKKHPKETDKLSFTFVTDGIENAIRQAKAAAKDKIVTIIGSASTTHQCLKAGLADELHIDIIPVFEHQQKETDGFMDSLSEHLCLSLIFFSKCSKILCVILRVTIQKLNYVLFNSFKNPLRSSGNSVVLFCLLHPITPVLKVQLS